MVFSRIKDGNLVGILFHVDIGWLVDVVLLLVPFTQNVVQHLKDPSLREEFFGNVLFLFSLLLPFETSFHEWYLQF